MKTKDKAAALLEKVSESAGIPSLSPLAIQLIDLAADDSSSASDLAAIIEKDPGLTTRLLKLAGSAFFSLRQPVTSISQAVTLLGFKRVRIMALSLSLRDTFPMDESKGVDYHRFWKTSLYRALISQAFSAYVDTLTPDEAFLGGLISEIGMLLLFSVCSQEEKAEFPAWDLPLGKAIVLEEERLGINHRELAGHVLQRWHFPEHVVECQTCFGPQALGSEASVLCKTVDLARRATDIVFDQTAGLHELQQQVHDLFGLGPETVNEILAEAFGNVEDVGRQLLVDVDSQADILAVMEKANQALARINHSIDTTLQGLLDNVSHQDPLPATAPEERVQDRKDILQNTLDAVAHEIRNPLLAIAGFSRRLARQAEDGEDRSRQYAKIIVDESSRLEGILKEILDYCRDYEPVLVEKDLISIVNNVLDENRGVFEEKQIEVVRDFFQDSAPVLVDADGIAQVLRQLLKNAVHMIGKNKGTVAVSVRPVEERGQVSVSISDDGGPIPDEIRDALMDGNLSTKTFGEGLGLPLARRIVEAHKGRLELRVKKGRGNMVTFVLPS